jgi:hypothetical protein
MFAHRQTPVYIFLHPCFCWNSTQIPGLLLDHGGLLLGKRSEAEVRLDDSELWPDLFRLLGLDRRVNNDIVTWSPVDRSGNLILITRLQRVDNAQHLGRVATSRSRVRQNGADGLLWVDDVNGSDGEGLELTVSKPSFFASLKEQILQCPWSRRWWCPGSPACRTGRQPCGPCRQ